MVMKKNDIGGQMTPGAAEAGPRRTRLEDIARRCGVSVSTVSRALSGEKGVSAELRKTVQDMARAVRYALPAEIGGARIVLAASRAAMVDYSRNQFNWYVLQGLRERAAKMDIEIQVLPIGDAEVAPLVQLADEENVAGVLLLSIDDSAILDAAAGLPKPAVLINTEDPLMRLSSVLPCNRSAARLATDYLVGLGHREIAFLACPGRRTIEQRREGWRDSLRHHGLQINEQLVIEVADWLPELAEKAVMEHVQSGRAPFTAVLCANDSLAMGVITGLRTMHFAVPGNVSVVGMNDLPQAEFMDPPLTTMHLPTAEIGVIALELLQDCIAGTTGISRRIELACALVERGSTGPLRRCSL